MGKLTLLRPGSGQVTVDVSGYMSSYGAAGRFIIPTTSWTAMVKGFIIGLTPIAQNQFGVFNVIGDIKTDKFKLAMLGAARHLWSSRKDNCQFIPKGKITSNAQEFNLDPIIYDGVQCPDEFFGSNWEVLFGTGNPMEMLRSPEGKRLITEILDIIMTTLQNDFWNIVAYGGNPIIDDADTNNTYVNYTSAQEWADFKDQMGEVGGFVTAADYLKAAGETNFALDIDSGDVSGATFTGDAIALLKEVRGQQKPAMRTAANSMIFGRQVNLVTRGIFEKLKEQIGANFATHDIALKLFMEGKTGDSLNGMDAIAWDGTYVVAFDQPSIIDSITGHDTHMVLCTVPKNIPILYNAAASSMRDFGFIAEQTGQIKDKGKIFMNAYMKVGTGFVNKDFVSYAVRRAVKA